MDSDYDWPGLLLITFLINCKNFYDGVRLFDNFMEVLHKAAFIEHSKVKDDEGIMSGSAGLAIRVLFFNL